MKCFCGVIFICVALIAPITSGQERPKPVSLIELIATPEKFDGKLVAVQGFLVLGKNPDFFGQQPALYVHQEDARSLIANSVWVASDQMRRDQEKIDHMYVNLTAVFRAARQGTDSYEAGTLTQIQGCTVWSNPERPIGESNKPNGQRPK